MPLLLSSAPDGKPSESLFFRQGLSGWRKNGQIVWVGNRPGNHRGLTVGWHTIELKVLVTTPYGTIDDWDFAQLHIMLAGDLDGDDDVDLSDLAAFVAAMNGPNVAPGDPKADLDGDGDCDLDDYVDLAAAFTGLL
ncbi:MAG TPA: hypothetical protein VMZ31_17205 [Phycisphaerae bacterium]|nr:hypothetical protein [Phycisphaerae bacterium]